jgi:hypothetical protein
MASPAEGVEITVEEDTVSSGAHAAYLKSSYLIDAFFESLDSINTITNSPLYSLSYRWSAWRNL